MTNDGPMPMIRYLVLIVLSAVVGCRSPEVTIQPQPTTARKFETAIAQAILSEVRTSYDNLDPGERLTYLHKKYSQFEKGVNLDRLGQATLRERDIFQYLLASEEAAQVDDFALNVRRLTSLSWTLQEFESAVVIELERLDKTIAGFATQTDASPGTLSETLSPTLPGTPATTFQLSEHVKRIRAGLTYPEDSFEGRQRYLDLLAGAMVAAQLDWYDTLETYSASDISLEGFEDPLTSKLFSYRDPVLSINLTEVENLPLFELEAIAIFYGFPGMHSLTSIIQPSSLQNLIELPGYSLGWAAYISNHIGVRDTDAPLHHMYFARLITGLALVDLRMGTATWDTDDAIEYLHATTPYTRSRLALMVDSITEDPGYYLAALAGKTTFVELYDRCMDLDANCSAAGFHQAIVEAGPMPFRILRERLGNQ